MIYGQGFTREGEILELGTQLGLLQKTGSWFVYNGEKIGNGKDAASSYLKEHQQIADTLDAAIKEKLKKGEGIETED